MTKDQANKLATSLITKERNAKVGTYVTNGVRQFVVHLTHTSDEPAVTLSRVP